MGKNSTTMKVKFIRAALAVIILAIYCSPAIADQMEKKSMQVTQKPVFKTVYDYIEFFRKGGERYDKKLPGLMLGARPDPRAMKVLGEVLMTDDQDVRQNIIRLLDDIRKLSDPGYELRTPEVIALLVGPSFAKIDGARDDAMVLMRKYASTTTLSRYEAVFLKSLKEGPEATDLRLIAKVKPNPIWALKEIDRLSQLPQWKNRSDYKEEIRIARAALGDKKIEDEYISDARRKEEAGDMDGLVESFYPLVEIGTTRTLRAVCQRVKSPLIYQSQGSIHRVSIRLLAMEALIYAFPEHAEFLDSNAIKSDEDYMRVEQFCVNATGVQYGNMPRPPFFTRIIAGGHLSSPASGGLQ